MTKCPNVSKFITTIGVPRAPRFWGAGKHQRAALRASFDAGCWAARNLRRG